MQEIIEGKVEKRTKGEKEPILLAILLDYAMLFLVGVYVPVGGKKLLTFLDDMNMPAKDTFGSQPPLELIRQWIDYGFWYDRAKQTVKQIKVLLPADAMACLTECLCIV